MNGTEIFLNIKLNVSGAILIRYQFRVGKYFFHLKFQKPCLYPFVVKSSFSKGFRVELHVNRIYYYVHDLKLTSFNYKINFNQAVSIMLHTVIR